MRQFSWLAVLSMSVLLTAVLACMVLMPSAKISAAADHAKKLTEIYSTGLVPCGANDDGMDALIRKYQPKVASLEIREFPALRNEARVVQIVGERIFTLDFYPLYKKRDKAMQEFNAEVPPKVSTSPISVETSRALVSLFTEDIRHSRPREVIAIDGVSYGFHIPGLGCAYTHSPSRGSRAVELTDIYFSLQKQATLTDSAQIQESDRDIFASSRALHVE